MASEALVYVVDDDDAMRDSLAFLLGAAGFTVHVFDSAPSFLAALPNGQSGCLVTDVRMPGMDGIELLKRVKHANPRLSVVIMTGHGDVPLAVEAMKLGALEFIEKPFEDERLVETIRAALTGAADAAHGEAATAQMTARIESLSPRERQVMQGLVEGLSNKAIARDYDISPRTVEVYRANLMTKMQAANLSELVRMAMRAGLLKD
ncbi:MAG TPA: response regulator FixJ [Roseiarcus sp.]|jgi:two-component system response regulator FixJ